jgi:WD40 repeat protein
MVVWSIETWKVVQVIESSEIVSCMEFHPLYETALIGGSLDKILRAWDVVEGKVIDVHQNDDYITSLAFS